MNRAALDAITLGAADGLQATGVAIIEAADPPDAAPFGKGLVGGGSSVTFVNRRKVAGMGPLSRIPRSGRVPAEGVVTVFGFSFPGRFRELGTIHASADPFLTPAAVQVVPSAVEQVGQAIKARLRGVK